MRRNHFLSALFLIALATGGCSPAAAIEQPGTQTITLSDGRGEQVSLEGPAERVVSLAPSSTEILFAIGASEVVVGRDEFSDYPPEVEAVQSIGNTYGELNVESIASLDPDLVLAAEITPPEQVQALKDLNLTVFVVPNPSEFEDLFQILKTVGELTGRSAQAEALAQELEQRYSAVTDALEGAETVSLLYEVDGSDPTAPWTTGSATFQNLMFELAGGENIAADIEGWGQLSLEEIVIRDPEVIIFGSGPFVPTTVESLKKRAGWTNITAVQEDRVYAVDTDLLDLPGPRLLDGLETVAALLHPERFE
jgi:iron complex transport system substrate-binding protein